MNKRFQGAVGEQIACTRLESQGRTIIDINFTIRGGELDIIAQNEEILLCVEVKTVGVIQDIMAYITDKKMSKVRRTFEMYLWKHPYLKQDKQMRIDAIFVKDNAVWEVFENVTGS